MFSSGRAEHGDPPCLHHCRRYCLLPRVSGSLSARTGQRSLCFLFWKDNMKMIAIFLSLHYVLWKESMLCLHKQMSSEWSIMGSPNMKNSRFCLSVTIIRIGKNTKGDYFSRGRSTSYDFCRMQWTQWPVMRGMHRWSHTEVSYTYYLSSEITCLYMWGCDGRKRQIFVAKLPVSSVYIQERRNWTIQV
jgi:hypothetical protein